MELIAERKRGAERAEALAHDYETRVAALASAQKSHDDLQARLTDAECALDRTIAQMAQMERIQKSQVNLARFNFVAVRLLSFRVFNCYYNLFNCNYYRYSTSSDNL